MDQGEGSSRYTIAELAKKGTLFLKPVGFQPTMLLEDFRSCLCRFVDSVLNADFRD